MKEKEVESCIGDLGNWLKSQHNRTPKQVRKATLNQLGKEIKFYGGKTMDRNLWIGFCVGIAVVTSSIFVVGQLDLTLVLCRNV